jgi:DNA polymerase-3 subunit beta
MKVTFDRAALLSAFDLAASYVPQKSPKDVLRNILLVVSGKSAILMATDTEVGVRVELNDGIEADEDGEVLLPVARVRTTLKESSSDEISMEVSGGDNPHLIVKAGRSKLKLPMSDPAEFPKVSDVNIAERHHEIDSATFKTLIKRTSPTVDMASERYTLGGVFFEMNGSDLYAVSTDGRRLSAQHAAGRCEGEHECKGAIVPIKAAQLIERSVGTDVSFVQVAFTTNDMFVRSGNVLIVARLMEGRFPNWRLAVPTIKQEVTVNLDANALASAMRQAASITDETTNTVLFQLTSGCLTLVASNASVGETTIEIPVDYDGEPHEVRFKHQYALDFCRAVGDVPFTLRMDETNPNTPSLLVCDEFQYTMCPVVMR